MKKDVTAAATAPNPPAVSGSTGMAGQEETLETSSRPLDAGPVSPRRWPPRLLLGLQGGVFLVFTLSTLQTTAPTFDEVAHLPAGYAQLEEGRARLNPEHPPLVKLLAASMVRPLLPPMASLGSDVQGLNEWQFGRRLLFEGTSDPQTLFLLARLPMILLGGLLLAVLGMWASALAGEGVAALALTVAASAPLLLAHTRLVTTDVPVASFGLLSAFLAWRWWLKPDWTRALLLGVALGATLAAKFSGVLVVLGLGLAFSWRLWRETVPPVRAAVVQLPAATVLAIMLVCLTYGPPFSPLAWLEGVRMVGFNHTAGYNFFLLGEYRQGGFPLYFPVGYLLKASPLELAWGLLGGIGALLWLQDRRKDSPIPSGLDRSALPFLLFPGGLYGLFIVLTAPDVGIRYLIPALPFAWLICAAFVGYLYTRLERLGWYARAPGLILALGLGLETSTLAQAWPDPLSYFNGLLGCRGINARLCLDDSNLDWGQDLARIASVVEPLREPDNEIHLLYFGTAFPGAYLTLWKPMQEAELLHPQPVIYVMSVQRLMRLNETLGRPNGLDWFARYSPVTTVGNTYLVYDFRTRLGRNSVPTRETEMAASTRTSLIRSAE